MTYISRSKRTQYKIEELLLRSNSPTAIHLILYSSEIKKLKKIYPSLNFVVVPESERDHQFRCIVSKKELV